jgi:Uncharacterised protein family (UPF0220)
MLNQRFFLRSVMDCIVQATLYGLLASVDGGTTCSLEQSSRLFFCHWCHLDPASNTLLINLQCSLGFFTFLDAASWSKNRYPGETHVTFVDWIPGICSTLGMLVINLIEKTQLSTENYSMSSTGAAWQARLVLFLGFALLAGGLAGSVVSELFYD